MLETVILSIYILTLENVIISLNKLKYSALFLFSYNWKP